MAEDVINAGVYPSVHMSGFTDIRLGAVMGRAAPSLCLREYDGWSVTYKGSPASNLCGRISSLFLSLSLSLPFFFFFFFLHDFIRALRGSGFPKVRQRESRISVFLIGICSAPEYLSAPLAHSKENVLRTSISP